MPLRCNLCASFRVLRIVSQSVSQSDIQLVIVELLSGPKVRRAEQQTPRKYLEDITRRREDMNFIFEW